MILPTGSEVVELKGLEDGPLSSCMGLYERTQSRSGGCWVYKRMVPDSKEMQPQDHMYMFFYCELQNLSGRWSVGGHNDIGSSRAFVTSPLCCPEKCLVPEATKFDGWNVSGLLTFQMQLGIRVDPVYEGPSASRICITRWLQGT